MTKQPVDVLVAFEDGTKCPRPLRFKILENGIKKTVEVSEVTGTEWLGAGGMSRIEYTCRSAGRNGAIPYRLLYYYRECRWEIER